MKKLLLLVLILSGIYPCLENSRIAFKSVQTIQAQTVGEEDPCIYTYHQEPCEGDDSGDPCDPNSSYYDPQACEDQGGDPCDPNSHFYDPSQCDSGDPCDPNSIAYDPYLCDGIGDPCDPFSSNYNPYECSSGDPCDPYSTNYDPYACGGGGPCDPYSTNYDPYVCDNPNDPCDPLSPYYDPSFCGSETGGGGSGGGTPFDPYNDPYVGTGPGDDAFSNLNDIVNASQEPEIQNDVILDEPSPFMPVGTMRLLGYNKDRNPPVGKAPDMTYGIDGDVSMITVTDYLDRDLKPDSKLFAAMSALMVHCSFLDSDMKEVTGKMVKLFHDNQSENTRFSDPVINSRVFLSTGFRNFMKRFGAALNSKLAISNGDIQNLRVDMDEDRPTFNGLYNKFHGLQVMMNDTQRTEIYLEPGSYSITPGNYWSATVTVKIYDNFGLDREDILKFQGWHHGFIGWYLLQHQRGYIPFETVVTVRIQVSSHF